MAAALPELADDRTARLAELQAMLAARDGQPGYKRNAQAIRAEIARLSLPQEAQDGQA